MAEYMVHHTHEAEDCPRLFEAWEAYDSPLKGKGDTFFCSCPSGEHGGFFHVEAANEEKEEEMITDIRTTARRQLGVAMVCGALLAGLTLGNAGTAFAAAAGPASCMGQEASNLSPPGSSDELPAGMRGFSAFFRDNFPGTPPGSFISTIAKLHEGSHAGCDEALEG
jgi:hypothetical protein